MLLAVGNIQALGLEDQFAQQNVTLILAACLTAPMVIIAMCVAKQFSD